LPLRKDLLVHLCTGGRLRIFSFSRCGVLPYAPKIPIPIKKWTEFLRYLYNAEIILYSKSKMSVQIGISFGVPISNFGTERLGLGLGLGFGFFGFGFFGFGFLGFGFLGFGFFGFGFFGFGFFGFGFFGFGFGFFGFGFGFFGFGFFGFGFGLIHDKDS
jgi:hypothetical protein